MAFMYLLSITILFGYLCFKFNSAFILFRKFIFKCLVNSEGEGGLLMHPFDFECVAHGMTLCNDSEC